MSRTEYHSKNTQRLIFPIPDVVLTYFGQIYSIYTTSNLISAVAVENLLLVRHKLH